MARQSRPYRRPSPPEGKLYLKVGFRQELLQMKNKTQHNPPWYDRSRSHPCLIFGNAQKWREKTPNPTLSLVGQTWREGFGHCATRISRTPFFTFCVAKRNAGIHKPMSLLMWQCAFPTPVVSSNIIRYLSTMLIKQTKRAELRAAWRQRKRDDRKRKALWYQALDLAVSQMSTPSSLSL